MVMYCCSYCFAFNMQLPGYILTNKKYYCNHLGTSDDLDEKLFMKLRLDEKHTCPDCLDTFDNRKALIHHRNQVCGLDLMYECNKCYRRFKHNHNLKAHGITCSKQKIKTPEKPK